MEEVNVVWFKRDIRTQDHAPLKHAIEDGKPILLLYLFEPILLNLSESSHRHWLFAYHSLKEIQNGLQDKVHLLYGDAIKIFEALTGSFSISSVYSYQETGQMISYQRDLALRSLFAKKEIRWVEFQKNGVIRALKNRDDWSKQWINHHTAALDRPDLAQLKPVELPDDILSKFSNLPSWLNQYYPYQAAGQKEAHQQLEYFLKHASSQYNAQISKPLGSRDYCSRMSPHLAWGTISMRQVYQALSADYKESSWKRSLSSFRSRLFWHCHFIQKFEREIRIEKENFNRAFDQIERLKNETYINAWEQGLTGFPLVDANIRCVKETGWINFRMRAMLVSFFTHHLFQDWRWGVSFLARQFTDFEPGIHFCQFQMQAGTTGINTFRIYNPIKQSLDHDPDAIFIKKWVPELKNLPNAFALEPWKITPLDANYHNFRPGITYPHPIVDLKNTYSKAKDALYGIMKTPFAKEENRRILSIHVKRK